MVNYIIKRLLLIIPVILCVAILIFTILYFVPGDPVEIKYGTSLTMEQKEAYREEMGLNDPYWVQLGRFMSDLFLHFDFGESYTDGSSVTRQLLNRMPQTFLLGIGCALLAAIIGIPLGINAAVHHGGWADTLSMIVALLGVSMPSFWVALMLVLVFALYLGWLPPLGMGGIEYYILPWASGCLMHLSMLARQARSSMLEVTHADYITTARAKGVSRSGVIFKHALPNAMLPVMTALGATLGGCISGSLILENVFSIPGVGQYMVTAISSRDYPAVRASVIIIAFLMSILHILVDLAYAWIDPRVKSAFVTKKRRDKRDAAKEQAE